MLTKHSPTQCEQAELDLRAVKRLLRTVRDQSDALLDLHPNDLSTHTAALPLRSALLTACTKLSSFDALLQSLWREDQALRAHSHSHSRPSSSGEGPRQARLDELIDRFLRRVGEVKREAKCERQERREADDRVRPKGLDGYLDAEASEVQGLWRTEAIPAARYVVENPFTVLARMEGYKGMGLAAMVRNADYWVSGVDACERCAAWGLTRCLIWIRTRTMAGPVHPR